MGHKIHPKSLRLFNNRDWSSIAYFNKKDYANNSFQNIKIRSYAINLLNNFAISDIVIKRRLKNMIIIIYSAKYGILMKNPDNILDKIKSYAFSLSNIDIEIDLQEIVKPDLSPKIVANKIAKQLEKNGSHRRAMKRFISKVIASKAKGVKIKCSGRLAGNAIARSEYYLENKMPTRTLRSDIRYALTEAKTSSGIIGVKVWIYC